MKNTNTNLVTQGNSSIVLQADFIASLDKAIHAVVKGQFDIVLLVAFELSTYTEKSDKEALLDYFADECSKASLADSTIKTLVSDTKKIALFAGESASLATLKSKVKSLGITSMSSFIFWLNREHTTKVAIGELTRDNRAAFIATKDNIKNVTDLREWLKGVKEAAAKEAAAAAAAIAKLQAENIKLAKKTTIETSQIETIIAAFKLMSDKQLLQLFSCLKAEIATRSTMKKAS